MLQSERHRASVERVLCGNRELGVNALSPSNEPLPSLRRAKLALWLLVPMPSLGTAAAMFWWPELMIGKALFLASKIWLIAFPLLWWRFVDRQPLSWSPPRRGGFAVAAGLGLLISLIIFAAYAMAQHFGAIDQGLIVERAAKTGLGQLAAYVAGTIYWVTLNSMLEEFVWRWFVYSKFEVLLGGKLAIVASALAFTAHHVVALTAQFNGPIAVLASCGVFIGGATWSWLYLRYRSIWPGYVSHAIVDVAVFVLGYRLIFGGAN